MGRKESNQTKTQVIYWFAFAQVKCMKKKHVKVLLSNCKQSIMSLSRLVGMTVDMSFRA